MNSDPFIYRIPGRNYWIYWIYRTYLFDGKKRNDHFAIDGDIQAMGDTWLGQLYVGDAFGLVATHRREARELANT